MRSVQLLIYRADEGVLEVRARDFKTHWMSAVEVLDDDTYLGAENSNNLFTLRKNTDAAADEDRNRLEVQPCPARPPYAVSPPEWNLSLCLEVGTGFLTVHGLLWKVLICTCRANKPLLAVAAYRQQIWLAASTTGALSLDKICTSPTGGGPDLYCAALQ